MKSLFISDIHLGDGGKTIASCNRPFASVEDYEESLIYNWNRVVSDGDTVYILGDLCCDEKYPICCFLEMVNGTKILIRGNHDHHWLNNETRQYFAEVCDMKIIHLAEYSIHLCHYPLVDWYKRKYGGLHVFGHVHNCIIPEFNGYLENSYNASVDINGFMPVPLNQLIENNEVFLQHFIDNQ